MAAAVIVTCPPDIDGDAGDAEALIVAHVKLLPNTPTVNDHVYGKPLTVSATVYLTPDCKGCLGIKMTPPRLVRLLPTDGLLESMMQCASAVPLPVNEWMGPAEVATFPPTSMKTGSPVGAV